MKTQGQYHLLTFVQGHSDSIFSNLFSSNNTRPFEAKFHMESPWDVGMKMFSNVLGHMTKMASESFGTKRLVTLKLGVQYRVLRYYQTDTGLTIFMTWSNLFPNFSA